MNNNVTITVNQALLSYLKGSEVEVTIDSVKDLKLVNNESASVALEPGEHTVKMFFKYLGANCGFASAKFAIGGNDVAVIEYNPPEILAMGGSISISTRTVATPKPKPAEVKPAAPKQTTASVQSKPALNNTNKSQSKPASPQKPVNNNANTTARQQNNVAAVNSSAAAQSKKTQPSNTTQQVNSGNTNTEYRSYNTNNYSNNYVKPVRNKFIAILLAVFLGGFGIHKFYTGKIVWGIIYLCLCWTGVPAYVALVEAIIYLFTSNQTFNDKFCS